MARRPSDSLIFDTLRLEGGLFVPAVLEKAARGEHTAQKAADYRLPKGLALVDEQGRAFRIASALQKTFEPTRARQDVDAARATIGFVTELLRDALGYSDLTLCTEPVTLADRAYPVTAFAVGGRLPVIIAPHHLELDEPAEYFAIVGSGARRRSAYQLAQQFLNASAPCTWAILTNGRQLRLVRDADTLTRPAFLEADVDLILRAQRYPDFAAFWRLFHASRAGAPDASGESYPWESWKTEGQAQGERVREGLRIGVTDALLALGTGFLSHPANQTLLDRLQSGELSVDGYFQQLLRLIYRCLFLFTAEERELLHAEDTTPAGRHARDAYAQGYAFRRLRARALRRSGFDRHGDLWTACRIVFRSLSTGEARLALPALGGLFSPGQCPDLDAAALENRALLTAMRHLRWSGASGQLAAIDYRNMGPEELGSVYESLLELVPRVDLPTRTFGFVGITESGSTSGNARKTSGSYYTPDSLVQELIKSALDPVIAQKLAAQPDRPVDALLSITVCDPSCGSGHFLLAAVRRLAERLAELRAPDGAVRPDDYRHALREVASRCLYGVDINPMAVELCRVALWLETVDPGKPLGFLDHHIRTGNSLVGTTPDLIAKGLPDDCFTAIEGDDKGACAELKKRNKGEREGFGPLFQQEEQSIRDRLRLVATAIEELDEGDLLLRDKKEAEFKKAETAADYRHAKLLADLWCAAFVIKKHYPSEAGGSDGSASQLSSSKSEIVPIEGLLLHAQDELFGEPAPAAAKTSKEKQPKLKNPNQGTAFGITTRHLRDLVEGRPIPADLEAEVQKLASQYHFFHWHLAFPAVFGCGGFTCILGNPPWERPKPEPAKYFASSRPDIADAPTSAHRDVLLQQLRLGDPSAFVKWAEHERFVLGGVQFQTASGIFPLSAVGKFNLGNTFVERARMLIAGHGRLGLMNVSGLATDDSGKELISDLMRSRTLVSFYDFENRKGLFPAVHASYKFSAITIAGSPASAAGEADFVFFAQRVEDLKEEDRHVVFSAEDILLLNPLSGNCPIFHERRQAELVKSIYRRAELRRPPNEVLWDWDAEPTFLFVMSDHSDLFKTREALGLGKTNASTITPDIEGEKWLPLYESKMFHLFEHRWTSLNTEGSQFEFTEAQLRDPMCVATPRYWMREKDAARKLDELPHEWVLAVREVTNATNERTVIGTLLPKYPVGHNAQVFRFKPNATNAAVFIANLNAFVFDYAVRTKVGGSHLSSFILRQLPILPARIFSTQCTWVGERDVSRREWLSPRVLELTYTAWDLEAFANDCGWNGPPFRWDEERRFLLRCELDAAFFHLYLGPESEWQQQPEALTRAFATPRHAVAYIMDTFPIVKRKDEAKHSGIYRTKETILQIYDALQESIRTGQPYQTRLDPPPADPRCCHPSRLNIPAPDWMDRPLVYPALPRSRISPALYRASVVPHLLYQAGGELSFDRFRRAYWLLTEPKTLLRYAKGEIGREATKWNRDFHDHLEKDQFIPHLRSAVRNDLRFIPANGQRRLQLRHTDNLSDDDHAIFDARLALWVAELWPSDEPISPLTHDEEAAIKELELVM